MIEIYQFRYFLAVIEAGSFTKAANRMNVTQPTLSAGIKRMEDTVGAPLFERSNRRVFLTDAGSRLLPKAKAVLHEYNLAIQSVTEAEDKPIIRLGVLSTIDMTRVSAFVRAYLAVTEYNVEFEIREGTEQEILNRLDDRGSDFALSVMRGGAGEKAIELATEPYQFILPPDHPVAGPDTLSVEDLRDVSMVVRTRCEVLSETSRYFTDHNCRPRLVYRTNNDKNAVAMVEAGVGGTLVPASLVTERVAVAKLSGFDYQRRIGLFLPRYQVQTRYEALVQHFSDFATNGWF